MKDIQNTNQTNSSDQEINSEEIAEIPERIADNVFIDIDDDSSEKFDSPEDNGDYEEITGLKNTDSISREIVDDYEKKKHDRSTMAHNDSFLDIEDLAMEIDGLILIKKKTEEEMSLDNQIAVSEIDPIIDEASELDELIDNEIEKEIKETLTEEALVENLEVSKLAEQAFELELTEESQKEVNYNSESVRDDIIEIIDDHNLEKDISDKNTFIDIELADEPAVTIYNYDDVIEIPINEKDTKDTNQVEVHDNLVIKERISLSDDTSTEVVTKEAAKEVPKVDVLEDLASIKSTDATEEKSQSQKKNVITIELPEELQKRLPDNFEVNELGKIDLNEAEEIANEDILSLIQDNYFNELEELHLNDEEAEIKTKSNAAFNEENIENMDIDKNDYTHIIKKNTRKK